MTPPKISYQQVFHSARWGAIGFGVGLAIVGAVTGALNRHIQDFNTGLYLATWLYALAGSLGGGMLGFAREPKGNIYLFAFAGTFGCGFGYFTTATIFSASVEEHISGYFAFTIAHLIQFAVMGVVVGALLGAVERNWKQVGKSALAGAVGFGLYYLVLEMLFGSNPISALIPGAVGDIHESIVLAMTFALWGAIGGIISGACLGIANAMRHEDRSFQA